MRALVYICVWRVVPQRSLASRHLQVFVCCERKIETVGVCVCDKKGKGEPRKSNRNGNVIELGLNSMLCMYLPVQFQRANMECKSGRNLCRADVRVEF